MMKKKNVEAIIAETKEALKKNAEADAGDTIFPWDHVFESMLEYPGRVVVNDGREPNGTENAPVGKALKDAPAFVMMGGRDKTPAPHKCPTCGHATVTLWFNSPAWTWQHLCGRAGFMTICPHCGKQLSMNTVLMN